MNHNIADSNSLVNIEGSLNPKDFKPEDLPPGLREYELKILK